MASHPHCHRHQSQPQPSCHLCYSCCSSSSSNPQPPQPSLTDHHLLLQSLAAHLLQSSQTHLYQEHNKHQRFQQQQQHKQQQQTQALITSLLHRIDALESSLQHLSLSRSRSPIHSSSVSLRDVAARTIQTHFRAFLARRSRTLRGLKDLAVVKSALNALKSSLSSKARIKYVAVLQKAIELLHRLDSVQGSDPMIREGKRSISGELVRFLEFVDRVSVAKREQELAPAKVYKKSVSFVEPVKKSRVSVRAHEEPFSNGDVFEVDDQRVFTDDQIEMIENLCKKVEGIGEMSSRVSAEIDEEEQMVNEEENLEKNVKNNNNNRVFNCETSGQFAFSAPMPVQMEPRRR